MGQFQKGMAKPANSGRKKGVPNKAKFQKVADILADAGIHPAKEILRVLEENNDIRPADQIAAWETLLSYCQAKPKEDPADDAGDEDGAPTGLENASDDALVEIARMRLLKSDEAM